LSFHNGYENRIKHKLPKGLKKCYVPLFFILEALWPGMVVHAFNPSTQEVEAGRQQVQDQPGLHN
jgi:hypothetical protein